MSGGRSPRGSRAARVGPGIFAALADGRPNMTRVLLLSPHLSGSTAGALLASAVHETKSGVELLLATRFPRPGLAALLQPIPLAPVSGLLTAWPEELHACRLAPERVGMTEADHAEAPAHARRGAHIVSSRA